MVDPFSIASALAFIEASGCFGFMLAYTIQILPKSLMAVPVGITQAFMGLFGLFCAALSLSMGEALKKLFPIVDDRPSKMKMLILFHVTFGTFIISDSLFGLETPPKEYGNTTSNNIARILHTLMIASAAVQGGGVVTAIAAHFVK